MQSHPPTLTCGSTPWRLSTHRVIQTSTLATTTKCKSSRGQSNLPLGGDACYPRNRCDIFRSTGVSIIRIWLCACCCVSVRLLPVYGCVSWQNKPQNANCTFFSFHFACDWGTLHEKATPKNLGPMCVQSVWVSASMWVTYVLTLCAVSQHKQLAQDYVYTHMHTFTPILAYCYSNIEWKPRSRFSLPPLPTHTHTIQIFCAP